MNLALHVFPWTSNAESAGLARDAAYLVRPDGYVALADPAADGARLEEFMRERSLRGFATAKRRMAA
jgi:hypothetical protein